MTVKFNEFEFNETTETMLKKTHEFFAGLFNDSEAQHVYKMILNAAKKSTLIGFLANYVRAEYFSKIGSLMCNQSQSLQFEYAYELFLINAVDDAKRNIDRLMIDEGLTTVEESFVLKDWLKLFCVSPFSID